ncbi:hypothetical protein NBRC110019_31930 [Neptunitalea chrysea]|uniref:Tetratricopeptide repeat-containing protein n=1 Tax=Neptunitalea chrysea TaxID=1647581 RepID=A0A9W6B8R5_9FLAO|nr:hypothetical protein [Neptunitalea chrysea]GLB54152.1 hypothetical protein NBRC110019_31930 [Neptunitalea chrysea]
MMKNRFALLMVALIGFLGAFSANAQDDCVTNLSLFSNDAKVKNYESAYPNWRKVFDNCGEDPSIDKYKIAIYYYGDNILEYKIENDPENKTEYVNLLLEMYTRYHKDFPTGKRAYTYAEMITDKAKLMKKENMVSDEELYNMYKDAFTQDKAGFNNEIALYDYFIKTFNLYKAEKLELQVVFDTYDDVAGKIEELSNAQAEIMNPLIEAQDAGTALTAKQEKTLSRAKKRTKNYEGISESLDAAIVQVSNCETLIPLFNKQFEEKKNDQEWLNRASNRLTEKDCTEDPLYLKIAEQSYTLKPTTAAAKSLGVKAYKNGDKAGAVKWFKEAIALETDKFEKSKLYTSIASFYSKSTAANYAREALKLNPSNKKAYSIIANAYAKSANECGTTSFEKRAVYWLAEEMAKKAGDTKSAKSYAQRAPDKAMIFNEGMAGKTIKIGCWINKTVKVPNL